MSARRRPYRDIEGSANVQAIVAAHTVERVATFGPHECEGQCSYSDLTYVTYFTDGSRLEMLYSEGELGYGEYTPGSPASVEWRFWEAK